ncbi:hypothetical protein EMIHUDRAFT_234067 [Emiliania huxleyi CCMP1516]|uniref:F-box domain-containing protein n=2 Tax=Emiliania huxleyi TaxID=2903 RepID=A0A0D3K046_EMIH1|nr:hypothetical protein EMIHUDRAFT_234067 [Emiliania huxleyi CCMP1516]EOD29131.1 hypothetical protein EMIHUDRAFT_234067 [Emiliania huxleyi CCMP1516]|eukprot:XP_005781560.1 hypothetical protein EMIHUDRAFT_234067 [Emiliania huxleyi CCMP1516]
MADSIAAPAAAESISLLDLDPELLLEAVQTLPLREQARCRQVCKLFYLLVSELERTTPFMATSVGSFDVVMRDLGPKMAAAPSLGLLFTHAAALSLGRFPAASCKSFAFDAAAPGGWEAQLKAQGCFEGGWKVFLLIARTNEADELVDALQAAHPDAAIIGGMATGDVLYRLRHGAASVVDEGAVGMMFSGNVPLAAFVSRGARVVGEGPYTFGEADLDVDPDAPEEQQILTHLTDPRGERQGALTTVLEVVAQRGAIRLAPRRGDAPGWEGGAVQFYAFDPQSCKQDLATRLAAMKAETERKGERLLGAAAFDATTFSKTFPATPLIGMYAGGEIGPPLLADAPPSRAFQVGGAGMHGFTAAMDRLGIAFTPGMEKEEIIQEIATRLPAGAEE